MTREEFIANILNNRFKDSFKLFRSQWQDLSTYVQRDLMSLEGQYNAVKQAELNNTVEDNWITQKMNRIREHLLDVVVEIPEQYFLKFNGVVVEKSSNPVSPITNITTTPSTDTTTPTTTDQRLIDFRKEFEEIVWRGMQQVINNAGSPEQFWYQQLLADIPVHIFDTSWQGLSHSKETHLYESQVKILSEVQSITYTPAGNTWHIPEGWLNLLAQTFELASDLSQANTAMRLLCLHEGLIHSNYYALANKNSGIEQFPKIVERADYHADVWAILHERTYSLMYEFKLDLDKSSPAFFQYLISILIKTMWAFDKKNNTPERISRHRFNRYLIWYWQLVRLQDKRCKTMKQALAILNQFPIIELKGLQKATNGQQQVYYDLAHKNNDIILELGILFNNTIYRLGQTGILDLDQLLSAFIHQEHDKIVKIITSAYHQIV